MTRSQEQIDPIAVGLAVGVGVLRVANRRVRRAASVLAPATHSALHASWLPTALQPSTWLQRLSSEGNAHAAALGAELSRRLDELVPVVLSEVLRRADITGLVLSHVDLDRVVAAADLDAAAAQLDVEAVVERVDVDSVVRRVDLDAVIERIDMDSILDRLDLTTVVLERVDLGAIAGHLDVDAVVARVDLDAVIERIDMDNVLDRLDLTTVVLQRVDLDALIEAVLARVDLIALAEEVIDGVDLPEIIRESTGSMASETVKGARMQGIAADEAVSRAVDRLLLRRRLRSTQAPMAPQDAGSSPGGTPERGPRSPGEGP